MGYTKTLNSKEPLQGVIPDLLRHQRQKGWRVQEARAQCWREAESRKRAGAASLGSTWVVLQWLEDRRGPMMPFSAWPL